MNETTSEKLPAEKGAAAKKSDPTLEYFAKLHDDAKLTRIPVAHLYYADTIDHSAGWESQMSNSACFRPGKVPEGTNRYFVADFIPAWQQFEVSAVRGPGAVPVTEYLPVAHIRRWKRAL